MMSRSRHGLAGAHFRDDRRCLHATGAGGHWDCAAVGAGCADDRRAAAADEWAAGACERAARARAGPEEPRGDDRRCAGDGVFCAALLYRGYAGGDCGAWVAGGAGGDGAQCLGAWGAAHAAGAAGEGGGVYPARVFLGAARPDAGRGGA